MVKKQSSLDVFFTEEKKDEKPKLAKEEKTSKPIAKSPKLTENDNDVIDEFEKEQDDEEDVIFEGAPVEHCPTTTCICINVRSYSSLTSDRLYQFQWFPTSANMNVARDNLCLSNWHMEKQFIHSRDKTLVQHHQINHQMLLKQ